MNCKKGQMVIAALIFALIVAFIVPVVIYFISNESRWTIKEVKSTRAFHLAEAGIERAEYKLKGTPSYITNMLGSGTHISGFSFDVVYNDISGGVYKINISSTAGPYIKITSIGKDITNKEVRTIEVTYKMTNGFSAPHCSGLIGGSKHDWRKGCWVHWGCETCFNDIDLTNDQDDVYWPKRYCAGAIYPWNKKPPTVLYPCGSSEKDGNYCGWASCDIGNEPQLDFDYYRNKAKNTIIPYPNDSSGLGCIQSDTPPYSPSAGVYSGYFPNANDVHFKGYQLTDTDGVIFVDNVQKNGSVTIENGNNNRPGFLHLEALLSLAGNTHLRTDGLTNYSVTVPTDAWCQYLAGKPRDASSGNADHKNPDSSATNEYPGDLGCHNSGDGTQTITLPCIFDTKKYTKNQIDATGVAFHGFLYSGDKREYCGGGHSIIVGCLWAKGGLDVDHAIIYCQPDVASWIKVVNPSIQRIYWKELRPVW